jgi:hypothetical protein
LLGTAVVQPEGVSRGAWHVAIVSGQGALI